ncbi:MAG: UBA/THIF-type binding protein, partial [Frankiales bacterium]|nr:UBA/THIF-type binding protein [Frankiales bacterium]
VGPAGPTPADVGRSRGEAARDRLRGTAPSARSTPLETPDLVVLAPALVLDEQHAAELVRRGVPHLLAEVRGQVGVVGPLVLPGRSSCLHCLDLTRADLDPGWPWLAAQLASPPAATPPCAVALAVAVAAQAAQQVLTLLDELPGVAVLDGTLEQVPPDYRWRRRSWSPHPACSCSLPETG